MARAHEAWRERLAAGTPEEAASTLRQEAEAQPDDAVRWLLLARAEHLSATSMEANEDGATGEAENASASSEQPGESRVSEHAHVEAAAALERAQAAAAHALRILAPDVVQGLVEDAPDIPWGSLADPQTAGASYWYALALADHEKLSGHGAWVAVSHRVREVMEHCAKVAPGVDQGGPDRFLGVYFAAPPVLELKDLPRARDHFERAAKNASEYLGNNVARAGALDVVAQDRASFETQLRHVLETDASRVPSLEAENRLAQRRAHALIEAASELFE